MLTSAHAADQLAIPANAVPPEWARYEFRLGAFYHAAAIIGPGNEAGGVDLNGEILTPRLPFLQDTFLSIFSPRLQAGGMLNFSGKTSYVYAGFAWTVPIFSGFFLEPMFGGAVHNGELNLPGQDADRLSLGCRELFHTGVSAGYQVAENWTVMATWEHLSNAHICVRNQGINNFGVKLGYAF